LNFRLDVEGLRAIAIILVVAYHAGIPWLPGGFIGVDVFFVLSGYLITGLISREVSTSGKIDFVNFYARRGKRLIPALVIVLLFTIFISAIIYSPIEQKNIAATATATAVYASNLWFAYKSTDYLAADAETDPLLHTWSLSVEEQFYIVWPMLILLSIKIANKHSRSSLPLVVIGIAGLGSLAAEIFLTHYIQPWAFFFSPTRAWEFALGAVVQLLPFGKNEKERYHSVFGWGGLLLVLGSSYIYTSRTVFPGVAALVPCIGTAAVLRAGSHGILSLPMRMLGAKPMQWVGKLSYSWYLWHWPVLVFAAVLFGPLSLAARSACALLSLFMAFAAYRLVENPIRHSKMLASNNRLAVRVMLSAAVVMAVISLTWNSSANIAANTPEQARFTAAEHGLPIIYDAGCHVDVLVATSPECLFGDAKLPGLVALFGDSHAAQWFPAIAEVANGQGYRLLSLTKSECPAASAPFFNARLGRVYTECDTWRAAALARIKALHPQVVFVASSYKYPLNPDEWTAGMKKTMAALSESGARIVVIRDTPRPEVHVPTCLARQQWRRSWFELQENCGFELQASMESSIYTAEKAVVDQVGNASMKDLTNTICESPVCNPVSGSVVKFRDSNHLSLEFASMMASEFEDVFRQIKPPQ